MRASSNNFDRILKCRKLEKSQTGANPSVTDDSFGNLTIIQKKKQHQQELTESECRQVEILYKNGYSTYELADRFGCHRSTISRALKKAGLIVTHKASSKDGVVENVLRLYEEFMTAKDIGKELGIGEKTVRSILRENGVRIRHSSEYRK